MTEGAVHAGDVESLVGAELFVQDMNASLEFYRDKLGLRVVQQSPDFAVVAGRSYLGFGQPGAEGGEPVEPDKRAQRWLKSGPRGVGVILRMMVDDVDAAYERATATGCVIPTDIDDRRYGMRDFIVVDPDGYLVRVASPLHALRE